MLQVSDIGVPEMDGGFPVLESGKCTSTVRWMDIGATWTPLNNVRNSLVSALRQHSHQALDLRLHITDKLIWLGKLSHFQTN